MNPTLETKCIACNGSKFALDPHNRYQFFRWTDGCKSCHSTGYLLTAEGQAMVDFVLRHIDGNRFGLFSKHK